MNIIQAYRDRELAAARREQGVGDLNPPAAPGVGGVELDSITVGHLVRELGRMSVILGEIKDILELRLKDVGQGG